MRNLNTHMILYINTINYYLDTTFKHNIITLQKSWKGLGSPNNIKPLLHQKLTHTKVKLYIMN